MSEPFERADAPWLTAPQRWRWLDAARRAPARAALLGCGVVVLLAWGLNTGWSASPPGAGTSAAAVALVTTPPTQPTGRVAMKPSALALAEQQRPLARMADLVAGQASQATTPEARLMRVYALMAQAQGHQALEEARRLTDDVPTFGLAQLVYADLLSSLTLATPGYATYPPTLRDASAERLDDLTAEARARVTAAGSRPPAGSVPSQFVFLSPSVHYAIAVDVSKSRLYLFENTASGPVLKRDYYASAGKLGSSKRSEGDLRTPLGVYFITGSVAPRRLAERYGAGALPLNYPNQLDQLRGRTGSGIWLHGVERASFTRAPLATDGCLALSNPDLRELSPLINRQSTPVVIAESLQWVAASQVPDQQSDFMHRFEAWREARQSRASDLQEKFYSQTVHTPAAAASMFSTETLHPERAGASLTTVAVNNLSVLAWHDEDDVMIVTYTETAQRESQGRVKRQYWLRQSGDWSIIFEGAIG